MENTLHLFDELLDHDPGSKIFFPLARLYKRQGYVQRAVEIVQKGVELHPDYLEAKFFLIELLYDKGDIEAAEVYANEIFQKLLQYEKFWLALKSYYSKLKHEDIYLATFLIERFSNSDRVDMLTLMSSGISHYCEKSNEQDGLVEPENDLDAEEVTQFFINSGIKTKTMAKLLAAQGEHSQAVSICDELLSASSNDFEKDELFTLREQSMMHLRKQADAETDKANKLYDALNSLATRLENRSA